MAVYVVAVKREWRAKIGSDWLDTLREAPGVELGGGGTLRPDARRVTVRVTDDGLAALRERLGAFCYIEPVILHERQSEDEAEPVRAEEDAPLEEDENAAGSGDVTGTPEAPPRQ